MYGSNDAYKDYTKEIINLKNEISFSNLINFANNTTLFDSLDEETRRQLTSVLCIYVKGSINGIAKSHNREDEYIRNSMK